MPPKTSEQRTPPVTSKSGQTFTLEEIRQLFEERYSVEEAAPILKLDPSYIRKLVKRKKIGHYRFGKRILIGTSHLIKYLSSHRHSERTYSPRRPASINNQPTPSTKTPVAAPSGS